MGHVSVEHWRSVSRLSVSFSATCVCSPGGHPTDPVADEKTEAHHIFFETKPRATELSAPIPSDGVPFVVAGKKLLACQHGCVRHAPAAKEETEHCYDKQGPAGASKKKGCQAGISIRHVVRYPEYKKMGPLLPEECCTEKEIGLYRKVDMQPHPSVHQADFTTVCTYC